MPIVDPWEEQRRRRRDHQQGVRRRRLRRVGLPIVTVVVVATVVLTVAVRSGNGDDDDAGAPGDGAAVMETAQVAATASPTAAPVATDLVAPDPADMPDGAPPGMSAPDPPTASVGPVEVDEVWLLDRGDGDVVWGITVRTPAGGATRSGVAVRVRLVSADDEVIGSFERVLDGVNERSPTAVAGRFAASGGTPVRLDFDITVGEDSADRGLEDLLDTRAVERDGDELRGRVRSSSPDDVNDVSMVLVWRDDDAGDDGDRAPIVDVVVYDIDRLRPDVDALFEIDLSALRTSDGLPDDVVWSPSG